MAREDRRRLHRDESCVTTATAGGAAVRLGAGGALRAPRCLWWLDTHSLHRQHARRRQVEEHLRRAHVRVVGKVVRKPPRVPCLVDVVDLLVEELGRLVEDLVVRAVRAVRLGVELDPTATVRDDGWGGGAPPSRQGESAKAAVARGGA